MHIHGRMDHHHKAHLLDLILHSRLRVPRRRRCQIHHAGIRRFHVALPCDSGHLPGPRPALRPNRRLDRNVYRLGPASRHLYHPFQEQKVAESSSYIKGNRIKNFHFANHTQAAGEVNHLPEGFRKRPDGRWFASLSPSGCPFCSQFIYSCVCRVYSPKPLDLELTSSAMIFLSLVSYFYQHQSKEDPL